MTDYDVLLACLGIDANSYERFTVWCLTEELVSELARHVADDPDHAEQSLWDRPDALKRFRDIVRRQTGRAWSTHDLELLFNRVRMASERHGRKPIRSGDLLRLLWNRPHECADCGRKPPDVVLHVDHVLPLAKGGSSDYSNLQFLCAKHNLQKGSRLEEGEPWLDLD